MGGQQFGRDGLLIDTGGLTRVLDFDQASGLITVEAGIDWPALMHRYLARQRASDCPWGFAQKQTGADHLSIGGAVSANTHGRGLTMPPLVGQIESLRLVDARGCLIECSRRINPGLFRLVVGGYGLFGAIYSVTLRLVRRMLLRRSVMIADVNEAVPTLEKAAQRGAAYGDFQYAIDPVDDSTFLRRGVLAWYEPAPVASSASTNAELSKNDWLNLLYLAYTDKQRAFDLYAGHYLDTHGQVYASDEHQMSTYLPSYRDFLRRKLRPRHPESLMISELFVPREALSAFMTAARAVLRRTGAEVIYGTVRLIEEDRETFLAWARGRWAGVIFNLRTIQTPEGLARCRAAFRGLIDAAIRFGGSYYLTYHRWATREQVLVCHPRLPEFLRLKREYDPGEVFRSDWYRHHRRLLGV